MVVGGWVEIVCGFLVAFGLLTRLAAFVASGEMAAAFFMMHASKGLIPYVNKGELAVVYCFVFFYIFLRGSGSWSIDAIMGKGKASATTTTWSLRNIGVHFIGNEWVKSVSRSG